MLVWTMEAKLYRLGERFSPYRGRLYSKSMVKHDHLLRLSTADGYRTENSDKLPLVVPSFSR